MTSQPRVSVIIPALQEEAVLGRTLSQFTQELREKFHLEIVVSDGGSTDGTLPLARSLADLVIEKPPNECQNISRGRNVGAKCSRGDILVFINADTVIENPEYFFEEIIRAIQQPGITGGTCNVGIYRDDERADDKIFHGILNWYFYLLNIIGIGMGRGECHVVRRETFRAVNGYNEAISAGEDFDLFLRLRRKGRIAFLRHLRVNESPRRYRKYGYLRICILWFVNAVTVFFLGRSMHKEWKPVR